MMANMTDKITGKTQMAWTGLVRTQRPHASGKFVNVV